MCRRCSDCVGMSHHWMDNTDFGDEDERIENNSTTHVCKHCEAMGDECGECNGEGEVDTGGQTPWGEWISVPCPECGGEGIVLVAGGKASA